MMYYGIDPGSSGCIAALVEPFEDACEIICLAERDAAYIRGAEPSSASPQESAACLLSHLHQVQGFSAIRGAVITVPALSDRDMWRCALKAFQTADISTVLLEEPIAAALYHIYTQYHGTGQELFTGRTKHNILVIDMGARSLKASLVGVSQEAERLAFGVLATGGDPALGGYSIDQILVELVLNTQAGHWCVDEDTKRVTNQLLDQLEQMKIKLTTAENAVVSLPQPFGQFSLTRTELEQHVLLSNELNLRGRVRMVMARLGKQRIPVNEVLLTGGSIQVPLIKTMVAELLQEMGIAGHMLTQSANVGQDVARGAAIHAALIGGCAIVPFVPSRRPNNVVNDIVIEYAGCSEILIPSGTAYPLNQCKCLTIKHALSDAVHLTLSETMSSGIGTAHKKKICNPNLPLPVFYTGDELQLHMEIGEGGRYQLEVVHKKTGEAVRCTSDKPYWVGR